MSHEQVKLKVMSDAGVATDQSNHTSVHAMPAILRRQAALLAKNLHRSCRNSQGIGELGRDAAFMEAWHISDRRCGHAPVDVVVQPHLIAGPLALAVHTVFAGAHRPPAAVGVGDHVILAVVRVAAGADPGDLGRLRPRRTGGDGAAAVVAVPPDRRLCGHAAIVDVVTGPYSSAMFGSCPLLVHAGLVLE